MKTRKTNIPPTATPSKPPMSPVRKKKPLMKRSGGKFLKTLKQITEETPAEIAAWSKDGSQYNVFDSKQFEAVLLQAFPNANPRTFFRQLSHYKIQKINVSTGGGDGSTPGSFSLRHALMLRDQPDRILDIECQHRRRNPSSSSTATATTRSASVKFTQNKRLQMEETDEEEDEEEIEVEDDEEEKEEDEEAVATTTDEYVAVLQLEKHAEYLHHFITQVSQHVDKIVQCDKFQGMLQGRDLNSI